MRRSLAATAILGVLLAACTDGAEPTAAPSPSPTPSPAPAPTDAAPTIPAPGPLVWAEPVAVEAEPWTNDPMMAVGADAMLAIVSTSAEGPGRSTVHRSTDGITWEVTATIDGVWIREVAADSTGFVAVGDRRATPDPGTGEPAQLSDTIPVVASSRDGSAWDVVDLGATPGGLRGVLITSSQTFVVGTVLDEAGQPRPAIWARVDGTAWERRGEAEFANTIGDLWEVANLGSRIVAVGFEPGGGDQPGPMFAWASADGVTWAAMPRPTNWASVLIGGLASGDHGFLLPGAPFAEIPPLVWRSTDGRTWDDGTALPLRAETDSSFTADVAVSGGRYVVVGDDVDFAEDLGPASGQLAIWTSDDAEEWTLVPFEELDGAVLEGGSRAQRIVHDDGRWLVYGTTSEATDAPVTWVVWIAQAEGT